MIKMTCLAPVTEYMAETTWKGKALLGSLLKDIIHQGGGVEVGEVPGYVLRSVSWSITFWRQLRAQA